MLQQQQLHEEPNADTALPMVDHADLIMIYGMRLLLSVTALLTLIINPGKLGVPNQLAWLILCSYVLHSAVLFVFLYFKHPVVHGKLICWLDVLWCGLIVYGTGGADSYFFPFFFFVILAASFQRGLDEGARITLASCVLLVLASVASTPELIISHLLLRTTFVMALGYMIAYWGGLGLLQKRRLALLREVSQQSNPRFGVDHTVASVLQKARVFFDASSCILVMREGDAAQWQLRTALEERGGHAGRVSQLSEAAVAPLMVFDASQSVLYAPSLRTRLGLASVLAGVERGSAKWQRIDADGPQGTALAELLDARSFIESALKRRRQDDEEKEGEKIAIGAPGAIHDQPAPQHVQPGYQLAMHHRMLEIKKNKQYCAMQHIRTQDQPGQLIRHTQLAGVDDQR